MRTISAWISALIVLTMSGTAQATDWRKPLSDGLDGPDFTPGGGLYYRENFEQGAGTVEFQTKVKLHGAGALRLSVAPLCGAGEDDCSERAEIWEKTELRAPYEEGMWYGFAVKFGDPIPTDDHRYVIAQWKRVIEPGAKGDYSPFLALRLRNGKLFATVETTYIDPGPTVPQMVATGCPKGSTAVWYRPDTMQMRALVATDHTWTPADNDPYVGCTTAITVEQHGNFLPEPRSGWVDYAVYTRPGPAGTGRIEIFANGRHVVTVRGHIGHAAPDLGEGQYFKFGPYRAAHDGQWTLYYDDFRRSPHCADVMKQGVCPVP